MNKTAFVHDPACLDHDTGRSHPERKERVQAIHERLERDDLLQDLQVLQAQPTDRSTLALVHDARLCADLVVPAFDPFFIQIDDPAQGAIGRPLVATHISLSRGRSVGQFSFRRLVERYGFKPRAVVEPAMALDGCSSGGYL